MADIIQMMGRAFGVVEDEEPAPRVLALPDGLKPEKWVEASEKAKPSGYASAVRTALDYYRGWGRSDTLASLAKMFPLTSSMMTAVQFNIVRLIIDEQARVFAGKPTFGLRAPGGGEVDEATAALWADVLKKAQVARKLKETNRVVRAVRRCFLRVTWDAEHERHCLTRFTPDKVFPLFDLDHPGDFAKAKGVLLELAPDGDTRRFEFWSADANFVIDAKGNPTPGESGGENPIRDDAGNPVVPIIPFGDADEDDGFWLMPSETLVDGQRAVNNLATHILHVAKHQGFGQWVFTRTERNADTLKGAPGKRTLGQRLADADADGAVLAMGPETPLQLPFGHSATHVAQAAPIADLVAYMQAMLKQIATMESIPAGTVLSDQRALSGVAMLIDRMPLHELRADQVELYREPVRRLLDMLRFVWSAYNPKRSLLNLETFFEPGELSLPSDPVQDAAVRQARIRDGLTSAPRELAREKGLSLDDAKVEAQAIQDEQRSARAVTVTDVAQTFRAGFQRPQTPQG